MLVFTSCINNYLPKARTLAESLKLFHPDWSFCLLLGEKAPATALADGHPFDRIIQFEEVAPGNYKAWQFQHKLVELCTAVKGLALNHFLEKENHQKVMYLDPDILVLNTLEPLDRLLDSRDILLTPHQLAPQATPRAIQDNEVCSLQHGIFNLGFLACANTEQGRAFSRFWADRLRHYCRDDKANGLFTDQKWCDLAPAYFSGLEIIRDPGCNAASWNLTDRHITQTATGEYLANGVPLRFYHFTGYDSGMGQVMSQVYGGHMPAVNSLWAMYDEKLQKNSKEPILPWSGNFFSDGTPIPDAVRIWYRDNAELQRSYPNPYDATNRKGLPELWRQHQAKERNLLYVWARKPFRLARLTSIYLQRRGGISAFPELMGTVWRVCKRDGIKGLLSKIRKFKQNAAQAEMLPALSTLLDDASSPQWAPILHKAFADKKGVLIIDHMYGGGANDYRDARVRRFTQDGQACLLARWDFFAHYLRLDFYMPDGSTVTAAAQDISSLANQKDLHFDRLLLNELVLWSIAKGGNHYLNLADIADNLLKLKSRNSCHFEIAIHDFYSICPSYTLLASPGNKYCHIPADSAHCKFCLMQSPYGIPSSFNLAQWRSTWQQLYEAADTVTFFSNSSAAIIQQCFHLKPNQIKIIPHEPLTNLQPVPAAKTGSKLIIGVVGHISRHKGADIVREMAALLDSNEKLTVIGSLEGEHPENVRVLGDYRRDQLPEIMEREEISICLVPSIWPETFCYVAQELMQMHMPLAVFPLGAQAERAANYDKGIIADKISAKAALESIRRYWRRQRA